MVKSVLGVYHAGLRDWFIQRISALIMFFYTVGLLLYFIVNPDMQYPVWHDLFAHTAMKIATILFILSLLFHAWVGMWTVLTDYIKPFVLRLILYILIFLSLVAFFFISLQIVWGV